MNAPQIIVVALWAINLLAHAANHGKQKPEEQTRYNLAVAVIRVVIWTGLLTWGGFFDGVLT